MRTLELLAPAKNLECGIAAIDHGADAVYIGAPRFGARSAAGNSLDDIRQLCQYAHQFGARVHVTVNTIIFDDELPATLTMIGELQEAGVDALLLQDMGVLQSLHATPSLWRNELHASTQCDTRTAEKVMFLQRIGFQRAVLARELSLEEISAIHKAVPDMQLEVFVHGALCVSYSGVCYASQHCFRRSANRGECAQFCRLKFDLVDADGQVIEHQRHLLSLKDLCQIDALEALADAGACSFKIEGRLKDVSYVKNVVAAYSQQLDALVSRRPQDYRRASRGTCTYTFQPVLKKTFNRGFTHYFLQGRQPDIASFDTPKAMGEYVGKVKELRPGSFNVAGTAQFANGDGLCFINARHELEGFRVNRAEGNRLFPQRMPANLRPGTALYRNNDVAFERLLAGQTATRKLPVTIHYGLTDQGFRATLFLDGETEPAAEATIACEHQPAQKPQTDNIIRQLSKLGSTPFMCTHVLVSPEAAQYFVPSSLLTSLRRALTDQALQQSAPAKVSTPSHHSADIASANVPSTGWQPSYGRYGYLYNIANQQAAAFYQGHGISRPQRAFELAGTARTSDASAAGHPLPSPLLMQCRHCLRYSLGHCVKRGGQKPTWREPLHLCLPDGRQFRLEFACNECQMNVYAE